MLDAYGIPGLPTDPSIAGGLNTQTISGYAAMGRRSSTPPVSKPAGRKSKLNFSKLYSTHSFKVGYELQTIHTDVLDFSPQYAPTHTAASFPLPRVRPATTSTIFPTSCSATRSAYSLTNVFTANTVSA